jgi:hypothetical protein
VRNRPRGAHARPRQCKGAKVAAGRRLLSALMLLFLILPSLVPVAAGAADQPRLIERPGKPNATISSVEAAPKSPRPASTAAPTEAPPAATESTLGSADLRSFFPSHAALAAIGFINIGGDSVRTFEDTHFTGLDGTPFEDAWQAGMYAVYETQPAREGVVQAFVDLEQFETPESASLLFEFLSASIPNAGTEIDAPTSSSGAEVVAWLQPNLTGDGLDAVFVMSYYGDVIVGVSVLITPVHDSAAAEVAARDLWMAVDATRSS